MPSVSSSSVPNVFDSSTVTTPSLPTLSSASAMSAPISGSPAEIEAVAHERLGEHDRGRGAVTGDIVGLLRDLLDEFGTDLLERLLELDLLRDRHTVVRDRGSAPLLLEHDVAAARAERDLDGVGER